VIYLLDVNALFALGVSQHEFHRRTESWVERAGGAGASFATCAITELGFLRILLQTSYGAFTLTQGQKHLKLLKSSSPYSFQFITDDQDAQQLPGLVTWPKQLTDGHLLALAKAHGATLATLDEGFKGARLIRG
jgi:uncharacterized protein